MPFQHHPHQVFPHQMRASLPRSPRSKAATHIPRQTFTDRLGLPARRSFSVRAFTFDGWSRTDYPATVGTHHPFLRG